MNDVETDTEYARTLLHDVVTVRRIVSLPYSLLAFQIEMLSWSIPTLPANRIQGELELFDENHKQG